MSTKISSLFGPNQGPIPLTTFCVFYADELAAAYGDIGWPEVAALLRDDPNIIQTSRADGTTLWSVRSRD